MGLLGSLLSAVVKVAVSPIAIVKDVVDVSEGYVPKNTSDLLSSAAKDVVEGVDKLL